MTMKQCAADKFQPVKKKLLQSIGQLYVCKRTATDRFQLHNRDVVDIVPFRTRSAEWRTMARPHSETCKKTIAARGTMKNRKNPEKGSVTIPLAARNFMQVIRQPEQILNSTCIN